MSDGLIESLMRRFPAAAERIPLAAAALESEDPAPFLFRYRRDALGGMDEGMFLRVRAAAREERDVGRRRRAARRALEQHGSLTEELGAKIDASRDVIWLEDLQRPFRKSKAGADPMSVVAKGVLSGELKEPVDDLLKPFCGADGAAPTAADQRQRLVRLVAEFAGECADRRRAVRVAFRDSGRVVTKVDRKHLDAEPWKPFRDFSSPVKELKPRLALTLRRAHRLGAVDVSYELPDETRAELLAGPLAVPADHPHRDLVAESVADTLTRVLLPAAGSEVLRERRRTAERSIIPHLQDVLRERLAAPPAGAVPVIAVVPGSSGSARVVVVDAQGRSTSTIALHALPPNAENERTAAVTTFTDLLRETGAKLVAVAGSRRARTVREWVQTTLTASGLGVSAVPVNEAAAAAWAESEAGKSEAPELPVAARTALSLARSVQDPLGESARFDLTEMPLDPNQHEVDQGELRRALDETASECIAVVGVDVNGAHAALLARVPGLDAALAKAIVDSRSSLGAYGSRNDVKRAIPEEAWQIASGFLRVRDGLDPLDATPVHPQGAPIVAAISAAKEVPVAQLVGNGELLATVDASAFVTAAHTQSDVECAIAALAVGGADPRAPFVAPTFNPGVERLRDLKEGADVDGVVTSVSTFGAFVDVGVRQLGLVHVSQISHDFVRDASQAVKPGDKVRVRVLAVDPAKRRISLSIKALLPEPPRDAEGERPRRPRREDGAPAFAGAGSGGQGGGFGGPRGPRGPRGPGRQSAPGAPGAPGAATAAGQGPGGGSGGRPRRFGDRGPREDARPAGPERPGTAPRRAAGRFGKKRDGEGGGGMFQYGLRRDDRKPGKGAPPPAEADDAELNRPVKLLPKPLDPLVAALGAVSAQLGIPARVSRAAAPAPAAAPVDESKMTSEQRRAARRAAARAAAEAAAAAAAASAPAPSPHSGGDPAGDPAGNSAAVADVVASEPSGGDAGGDAAQPSS